MNTFRTPISDPWDRPPQPDVDRQAKLWHVRRIEDAKAKVFRTMATAWIGLGMITHATGCLLGE